MVLKEGALCLQGTEHALAVTRTLTSAALSQQTCSSFVTNLSAFVSIVVAIKTYLFQAGGGLGDGGARHGIGGGGREFDPIRHRSSWEGGKRCGAYHSPRGGEGGEKPQSCSAGVHRENHVSCHQVYHNLKLCVRCHWMYSSLKAWDLLSGISQLKTLWDDIGCFNL